MTKEVTVSQIENQKLLEPVIVINEDDSISINEQDSFVDAKTTEIKKEDNQLLEPIVKNSFIEQDSFVDAKDGSDNVVNNQLLKPIVNVNKSDSFGEQDSFVDAKDSSDDKQLEPVIVIMDDDSIALNDQSFVDAKTESLITVTEKVEEREPVTEKVEENEQPLITVTEIVEEIKTVTTENKEESVPETLEPVIVINDDDSISIVKEENKGDSQEDSVPSLVSSSQLVEEENEGDSTIPTLTSQSFELEPIINIDKKDIIIPQNIKKEFIREDSNSYQYSEPIVLMPKDLHTKEIQGGTSQEKKVTFSEPITYIIKEDSIFEETNTTDYETENTENYEENDDSINKVQNIKYNNSFEFDPVIVINNDDSISIIKEDSPQFNESYDLEPIIIMN